MRVCVLDSGRPRHPRVEPRVVESYNFVPEEDEYDWNGHSTGVCGVIAGEPVELFNLRFTGVAPSAELITIKVLNYAGMGDVDWVLQGMEKAVEVGCDIINMSLGDYIPCCSGPFRDIIVEGVKRGKIWVCASGNAGPERGTIACPANVPEAIAVGSSSIVAPEPDTVSWFSSRGPGPCNGVKPLLTAPGGNWIPSREDPNRAEVAEYIWTYWFDPTEPERPEKYWVVAGTSFSAPHVAGSLALIMEEVKPSLDKIVRGAKGYCRDIGEPGVDADSGYGRIDTYMMYKILTGVMPVIVTPIIERAREYKKYLVPIALSALAGIIIYGVIKKIST